MSAATVAIFGYFWVFLTLPSAAQYSLLYMIEVFSSFGEHNVVSPFCDLPIVHRSIKGLWFCRLLPYFILLFPTLATKSYYFLVFKLKKYLTNTYSILLKILTLINQLKALCSIKGRGCFYGVSHTFYLKLPRRFQNEKVTDRNRCSPATC